MAKITRTLPYRGGFISPPVSRAQTNLGCPDWNNLCLAPDGDTFRPLPGYRRTYPYNLLQSSGTKYRVVSFIPQGYPFTGYGRGIGVVDEITGRITGLCFHPGQSVQAAVPSPSPFTLGKLNRQYAYDYPAILYFRSLTQIAIGFEEQYCFDGQMFRRVGIRGPEFPPLVVSQSTSSATASGLTWAACTADNPDNDATVTDTTDPNFDSDIPHSSATIHTVEFPEGDNKPERLVFANYSHALTDNPKRVGFWLKINAAADTPQPYVSPAADPTLSFVVATHDSGLTGRARIKQSPVYTSFPPQNIPVITGIDFRFQTLWYFPIPTRSQGVALNIWFYCELDLSNILEYDENDAPSNATISSIGFAISKSFGQFLKNNDVYSFSFMDPVFFRAGYNSDYVDNDPGSSNPEDQILADDLRNDYSETGFSWHDTQRERESTISDASNPIRYFGLYTPASGWDNGDGTPTLSAPPVNLTFKFTIYTDARRPGLLDEAVDFQGVFNPIPDDTVDDVYIYIHRLSYGTNEATGDPIYRRLGSIPVSQLTS